MSANIYWSPVEPTPRTDLATSIPSRWIEMLSSRYGSFPIKIGTESMDWLMGVAAAGYEKEALQLVDAIARHGRIMVEMES